MKNASTLLKQSWSTYRANVRMFMVLASVPFVLQIISIFFGMILPFIGVTAPMVYANTSLTIVFGAVGVISFLLNICATIASGSYPLVLIEANADLETGRSISVWQRYKTALRRFFFAFIFISILSSLVLLPAMFLFLIPGIYVLGLLSFTAVVFVVTGRKGFDALAYSASIVKGRWWKTAGRLGLAYVIALVVGASIYGIAGLIFFKDVIFDGASFTAKIEAISIAMASPSGLIASFALNIVIQFVSLMIVTPFFMINLFQVFREVDAAAQPVDAEVVAKYRRAFKRTAIAGILVVLIIPVVVVYVSLVSARNKATQAAEYVNVAVESGMIVFSDPRTGVSFYRPSDWKIEELTTNQNSGHIVSFFGPVDPVAGRPFVAATVAVYTQGPGMMTVQESLDTIETNLGQAMMSYDVERSELVTAEGRTAYVMSLNPKTTDVPALHYVFVQVDEFYLVAFFGVDASVNEATKEQIKTIVGSLKTAE